MTPSLAKGPLGLFLLHGSGMSAPAWCLSHSLPRLNGSVGSGRLISFCTKMSCFDISEQKLYRIPFLPFFSLCVLNFLSLVGTSKCQNITFDFLLPLVSQPLAQWEHWAEGLLPPASPRLGPHPAARLDSLLRAPDSFKKSFFFPQQPANHLLLTPFFDSRCSAGSLNYVASTRRRVEVKAPSSPSRAANPFHPKKFYLCPT